MPLKKAKPLSARVARVGRPKRQSAVKAKPQPANRRRVSTNSRRRTTSARSISSKLANKTVLIDDRAGSKKLIKYPPFDQCGHLSRLNSGDVCFLGNGPDGQVKIGIELKSVTDLLSSSDSGRIQATQLPAMLKEYDSVVLVYYGVFQPNPSTGALQIYRRGEWRDYHLGKRTIPYTMLAGFLIALHEVDVHTIRASSFREAVYWIEELMRWRSKPWEKHKSLRAFNESRRVSAGGHKRKRRNYTTLADKLDEHTLLKARVASCLPALGYNRAVAAAKHFSTVAEMVQASSEEWSELVTIDRATKKSKRFGKVVGEAVVRALNW